MAQIDNEYAQQSYGARTDVAVDEGLRTYMQRVYSYMAAGVALTGIVAYVLFTFSITTDPTLAASSGGSVLALHRGMYLTPFGQLLYAASVRRSGLAQARDARSRTGSASGSLLGQPARRRQSTSPRVP